MRHQQRKNCRHANSNSWPPTRITPPVYSFPLLLSYLHLLPFFLPSHSLPAPFIFPSLLSLLTPLSVPSCRSLEWNRWQPSENTTRAEQERNGQLCYVQLKNDSYQELRLFRLPKQKHTHTKTFMVMDVNIRTCYIDRCIVAGWKLTRSVRHWE